MRRRKAGGKSAGLQKPSPSQPRGRGSAAAKETNAARLRRERDEALEHQRVTSEVLGVISNSPTDSASTLGAIAESIARLLGVNDANILRLEGAALTSVAKYGLAPQWPLGTTRILNRDWVTGRAVIDRAVVHVPDLQTQSREFPEGAAYARQYGHRTILAVPLLREGSAIGAILIRRMSVRPFTPRQIELVKNFAAQSVIAIENARLLDELRESLRQQTATANVLKAISRSAFDLQTVLDTLVKAAAVLCDAERNILFRREGNIYRSIAYYNYSGEFQHYHETHPITPGRGTTVGRTALEGKTVHITDVLADKEYTFIDAQKLGQYRANLGVPLLREGKPIGALSLTRSEPRPFTDKQIKLVETFADQAVIAIENARLFDEVQARTRDLQESLQQQTATGDVLKIISRSPVDLTTVLDTLVETVARLCHADQAVMWRRRDDLYHVVAWHGLSEEAKEFVLAHPVTSGRGTVSGRAALERGPVHVSDVLEDPDYTYNDAQKLAGYRSLLSIPLLRENELIGIFSIHRTRVDPFTSKEIELASSFADQAVIAIENARLFEELRDRQAELRVTFDNMGDGVVMFDAASATCRVESQFAGDARSPRRLPGGAAELCGLLPLSWPDRGEYVGRSRGAAEPHRRRHQARDALRTYAARWPRHRGAPQTGTGRRLRADLCRHHRAQARRGGTFAWRETRPKRLYAICRRPRTVWSRPKSWRHSVSSPPASRMRSRTLSISSTISLHFRLSSRTSSMK